MKTFNVGCQLQYSLVQPTTMIFNIQVVNTKHQKTLQEDFKLEPSLKVEEYISSPEGNRYIRVNAPTGDLKVSYQATVELLHFYAEDKAIAEIPPDQLPPETFYYLYPSRYCQSDLMVGLAESEFGELEPGYSRVSAICHWIYDKVKYLSGSSNSQTSAYDTATERAGVCRDFAHLGIAFCRALNIPARFVSAYAYKLEPPDFHACFEAYLGDRWYLFDATQLAPLSGIIRIGTGRDAADVSFGTLFGSVQMNEMKVFAELAKGTTLGDNCEERVEAIAIA
ncbi:MAG TPA: transglutaminase family protein [Kamptonema sp.]|nr:transglutaminase family protein [Kamptonema sp.]